MPAAPTSVLRFRFGAFELDLEAGELRRAGLLLKLSPQQFQVLRLLLENAGQLVSREQIQQELWGDGTFVDFDRNLNVCIAQIRATLNDDADAPRYIQTVPKRGYRFISPVERLAAGPVVEHKPGPPRARWFWILTAAALASASMAVAYYAWRSETRTARILMAALPFENLSGDPKEDLFTAGLTDELISEFGSLSPDRLGVIGRTSVMRYKDAPHAIDQIGRELHVDYVLEGTVRRSGGRVRVSSRLIKVADQAQVWSDTAERDESEMFRMQDEASARIANAISAKLLDQHTPPASGSRPANQAAYDAYLNGRFLQHKGTRSDLERSTGFFEEAARLDPRFDQAYSAAAETAVALGRSGSPPEELFPSARAAAEKALALNQANAEAHNALANVFFWYEWNWPLAEQHFTRAIAINASSSLAYHDYAFFLVAMGRTEQGLASLRRAIAIDPLSARVNIDAGWLLLQAHRFDEAVRQAQRAEQLQPGLAEARACIERSLLYQKKYRELAASLHVSGLDPEETLRRLYRQKLSQAGPSADPSSLAMSYAFLGDKDRALAELEQAYQKRSLMMPLLATEPAFAALHGEPRFEALRRELKLP